MLRWYLLVGNEKPQLAGRALYQQVVARRSELSLEAARGVLRRACQRFCEWPSMRKLRFRDVVHYVVI
jgi:hypothetical protein